MREGETLVFSGALEFSFTVSFKQLQNALAASVQEYNAQQGTSYTVAQLFGAEYDLPTSWIITNFSIGQEVYDFGSPTDQTFIGGGLQNFFAGAAK